MDKPKQIPYVKISAVVVLISIAAVFTATCAVVSLNAGPYAAHALPSSIRAWIDLFSVAGFVSVPLGSLSGVMGVAVALLMLKFNRGKSRSFWVSRGMFSGAALGIFYTVMMSLVVARTNRAAALLQFILFFGSIAALTGAVAGALVALYIHRQMPLTGRRPRGDVS